jgi:hypothetical protein
MVTLRSFASGGSGLRNVSRSGLTLTCSTKVLVDMINLSVGTGEMRGHVGQVEDMETVLLTMLLGVDALPVKLLAMPMAMDLGTMALVGSTNHAFLIAVVIGLKMTDMGCLIAMMLLVIKWHGTGILLTPVPDCLLTP